MSPALQCLFGTRNELRLIRKVSARDGLGWMGAVPEIESRRARPEAAQDPLALNQQIGFQFGITAQDGCGTGLAWEW